jgi:hypothetical protein
MTGGAGISPRLRTVYDGYTASFDGICRGCGMRYRVGERIHSPGKGMGAYHLACKMPNSEHLKHRRKT